MKECGNILGKTDKKFSRVSLLLFFRHKRQQIKDKNACVMKDLSNIINNDRDTELPSFFFFLPFSQALLITFWVFQCTPSRRMTIRKAFSRSHQRAWEKSTSSFSFLQVSLKLCKMSSEWIEVGVSRNKREYLILDDFFE